MLFSPHRVVVFLQIATHHDNCARSRALNNKVYQIISKNEKLTVEGEMVVEVVLNVVDEEEHALVTAEHW